MQALAGSTRSLMRKSPRFLTSPKVNTQQRFINSIINTTTTNFINKNRVISNQYGLHNIESRYFASATIKVPNMGDSITEGTLVQWVKNKGDYCNIDDVVAVVETDKVSVDIRTDQAGVLTEQMAKLNDTLQVGAALFKIDTDAKPSQSQQKSSEAPKSPKPATQETKKETSQPRSPAPKEKESKKPASPAPKSASKESSKPQTVKPEKTTPKQAKPITAFSRSEERVTMTRMRQRIAQRLKESQNTAASLTTFNEIDMNNIMKVRNTYKDIFGEKHNVKLGFMSIFVKAACSALRQQPAVNAYIEDKDIVYHDYCDVSVAVASPNGLVVPVIRNAESLSFADVERQIQEYSQKAKTGSLTLEEMSGGTFTISNGGVFGSLMGTPILNPPQSAILGMHGVFNRPVAVNDKVEIRPMMYVALTYDHRIIDGREAVLFLKRIKECVEDPVRLLLDS